MKLVPAAALGALMALAPAALWHTAATAQEFLGKVTATLNGEEREWLSIHQEGSQSGSYFVPVAPGVTLVMIHAMYGHAPDEDMLGQDWIDVTFEVEADVIYEEVEPQGARLEYYPQGLFPYYSSENGGEARIRLAEFGPYGPIGGEGHEGEGWAKGTYSAVLVRVDDGGEADPSDRLVLEGEFEVMLRELR